MYCTLFTRLSTRPLTVIRSCDRQLRKGVLPAQAKANNLTLSDIPPELACLNALEVRLIISFRVPFIKLVALPVGKQRCMHSPALNVPSKLDSVFAMLPRLYHQKQS